MPSPSTEVPLAFSWREIRQRGGCVVHLRIVGAHLRSARWRLPSPAHARGVGPAPAGARPRRLPKPRSTLRQASSGGTWQRARSPVRPSHHHRNEAGRAVGLEMAGRVDIKNGIVSVRRTLTRSGGPYTLGAPKTKKSRRSIRLTPRAIEALEAHLDRQLHEMGIL